MFILKNDKMTKFYENKEDIIDFLKNSEIHPSLMEIYTGDIQKIKYSDLLEEIDIEKINMDANEIFLQADNKIKCIDEFKHGYTVEKQLYIEGIIEKNITGFNPTICFKINIFAGGDVFSEENLPPKIDNKKLKNVFEYNGWEAVKIMNNGLVSKKQLNCREYIIFLTKKRECFLKG